MWYLILCIQALLGIPLSLGFWYYGFGLWPTSWLGFWGFSFAIYAQGELAKYALKRMVMEQS